MFTHIHGTMENGRELGMVANMNSLRLAEYRIRPDMAPNIATNAQGTNDSAIQNSNSTLLPLRESKPFAVIVDFRFFI